jgi:hypothetical protein
MHRNLLKKSGTDCSGFFSSLLDHPSLTEPAGPLSPAPLWR